MPRVTIVVPVYNGEDSLRRCVNSILGQSLADLEVVVVDDGSIDDTWQTCQELERLDARVRSFTKQNGGANSARAFGLARAQGDYVMFADSDDMLFPGAVEALANALDTSGADLAVGDYVRVRGDVELRRGFVDPCGPRSLSTYLQEQMGSPKPLDFYFCAIWNKMYRRQRIQNARAAFTKRPIMDATAFVLDYLDHATTVMIVREPIYRYEYRTSSIRQRFRAGDAARVRDGYLWMYTRFDGLLKNHLAPAEYADCSERLSRAFTGTGSCAVSVIVAADDSEAMLARAIDSLLAQDLEDFEVIVASARNEAVRRLAASYAAKDPRVRLAKDPATQHADARNHALDEVRGTYVLFMHATHTLAPWTLGEATRAASATEAALVVWNPTRRPREGSSSEISAELFAQHVARMGASENMPLSNMLFSSQVLHRDEVYFTSNENRDFCLAYVRVAQKVLVL